jgi:hypothetical protein
MQFIASLLYKIKRTKVELKTKQINKVVIQFANKMDFQLCLSNYVGSENGKVFDSKSFGCKAKPPQWHACLFVTAGQTNRRT